MIRLRFSLWLLLAALVLPALSAETIAIVALNTDERDGAAALVALVEQGAMEYLFQAGHIVFNLPSDVEAPVTVGRAVSEARAGGASFVVVLDVTLEQFGLRGLRPRQAVVTLVDVERGEERDRRVLEAETLDRFHELGPQAIAERLGTAASAAVAGLIGEGGSW